MRIGFAQLRPWQSAVWAFSLKGNIEASVDVEQGALERKSYRLPTVSPSILTSINAVSEYARPRIVALTIEYPQWLIRWRVKSLHTEKIAMGIDIEHRFAACVKAHCPDFSTVDTLRSDEMIRTALLLFASTPSSNRNPR